MDRQNLYFAGSDQIPETAQAIRRAARLDPPPDHVQWSSLRAQTIHGLARQLGERYSPERARLDAFVVSVPAQEAAKCRLWAFLGDLEAVLAGAMGLVLYGTVGTGKDHLLAAALYAVAANGIPVSWVSGEDVYLRIRDSMDTQQREAEILDRFVRPSVLGISDPIGPRGNLSEWNAGVLQRLLDQRYRAMRLTWMTLNAESEDDAKAKLGPVIWDRFRDSAEIIPCFWPSHRQKRGIR